MSRPYEDALAAADAAGRVLKREHIYGTGPPVNELSGQVQQILAQQKFSSVVDFGAGCGALAQYLPPECTYLGIEANPSAVATAKQLDRNVILGNILHSEIADNSYDLCTMIEVLEHIDDYPTAIAEARRVCRSHLFLTVPNIGVLPDTSEFQMVPWHLLEATHVNFFTQITLRRTLLQSFSKVDVWPIHEWFRPGLFMNLAALAWK